LEIEKQKISQNNFKDKMAFLILKFIEEEDKKAEFCLNVKGLASTIYVV